MDFTREPIIQSVITPKEGCKLVIRSSKAASQEEFFVDSVEVVSFGDSFYFRSLERPKAFFVPASDYEILEVRETRVVLKNVGLDRTIKIGGGREAKKEKEVIAEEEVAESRVEKKREKRRHSRRRRSKEAVSMEETKEQEIDEVEEEELEPVVRPSGGSSLLPPPSTLISETIARYKDNALFKDAFFLKDEDELETDEVEEGDEFPSVSLPQPEYGSFEMSEEEEEEIFLQRQKAREEEERELEEPLTIEEEPPVDVMEDVIGGTYEDEEHLSVDEDENIVEEGEASERKENLHSQ